MKVVINERFGGFGLSDKAIERCIELGMTASNDWAEEDCDFYIHKKEDHIFGSRYSIANRSESGFRCNPIVVQVVEELGSSADGDFAELCIVDIPFDDHEGWYIDDYDGVETIHENHRSWS